MSLLNPEQDRKLEQEGAVQRQAHKELVNAARALERQLARVRKLKVKLRQEEQKAKDLRRALDLWSQSAVKELPDDEQP